MHPLTGFSEIDMAPKPAINHLDISDEVDQAIRQGDAVVALESTIISHGMPYPRNVETARRVEDTIRSQGAVPASIAIVDGRLKVGLSDDEIELLGKKGQAVTKTSRRDIPFIVARGEHGATTVAATMIIAAMAGIRVFATGGIGGVHRGAESSMDISADLEELSNTDVAVVCAGVKSILDIGLTLEYLETKGVPVVGYQTDSLPAFYTRNSGFAVDYRVDNARQIANAMQTKQALGLSGGMIIGNPIPQEYAMADNEIQQLIDDALVEMEQLGIGGKDATPFMLGKIAQQSEGRSLDSNIELVVNNARLGAEIALEFAEINRD